MCWPEWIASGSLDGLVWTGKDELKMIRLILELQQGGA
jgi:hypothetical protein